MVVLTQLHADLHHILHEAETMAGQPAYIVNVPGASGQKGAKQVLGEKADGYTLYMINIGTFIVGELAKGKDKPYSVKNDWVNLGCMSQLVTSIQVHTSNPAKSVAEFVANAKASGKTHTWGTSGATTMHSGIGHLFFDTYGIPHKKVPFKGGSKARAAIVSQSVESVFGGNNTIAGFEDTIRPLATAGAERDPTMPDLPTFGEQGMAGADFTGLFCLFAPKGVSEEVKDKGRRCNQTCCRDQRLQELHEKEQSWCFLRRSQTKRRPRRTLCTILWAQLMKRS